jgi:hypothetical protein
LVEHWDGTSWSIVSSPAFAGANAFSVSADSSTDVWATGGQTILHFDGTSWSSRTLGAEVNLVGVVALSPTSVWFVGSFGTDLRFTTLIEHWDGTSFSVVSSPNPNPSGNSELRAIVAVSANDVWAVGTIIPGGVTEHWDGTSWSLLATPSGVGTLEGVTALSDGTVVAVGQGSNGSAVILHS